MRSSLNYHDIVDWCRGIFPKMRVTRVRNFAAVIWSILSAQKCTQAAAARSLRNGQSFNTNRTRIKRFFSWKTITLSEVSSVLIPLVIARCPKRKPVSIILDTTSLFWHLNCLVASVPLKGRAIPIAARLYFDTKIPLSQNKIEEQFVRWLVSFVPSGYQICLVADRGFGRTSFLKYLTALGVFFVIRVKHDVTITDEKGKQSLLSRRWTKLGRVKWLPNCSYRADGAVVVNLLIARQEGAKESWYLATNLNNPQGTKARYEQRFQIEETFKDAKHQLNLEQLRLRKLSRVAKLIAALLVAIVILLYLGVKAETYRELVDSGNRLSLVALVLILLTYPPPHFRRTCLSALNNARKGKRM